MPRVAGPAASPESRPEPGLQPGGVLVLAATPIGDPRDASPRLADELATADVVAAEDTRRLRRLATALGVRVGARLVSYHDHNETERTDELVGAVRDGARVVLVTDAGMPTVSDPGYRLVRAAVDAGLRVTAVPGASAVLTALAVSGLPVDRFAFEGFLPRRAGERSRRLAELATDPRTLVFFEAPHRLPAMLTALATSFGGTRPAAVCRELTKTYEEVRRGSLDGLVEWAAGGVRGEVTVVVGGATSPALDVDVDDPAALAALVSQAEASGQSRKEALAGVARAAGVPRRQVYDAVVASRGR